MHATLVSNARGATPDRESCGSSEGVSVCVTHAQKKHAPKEEEARAIARIALHAMLAVVRLAFVFSFALAIAACSNDEFVGGDAAQDSGITPDASSLDATGGDAIDDAPVIDVVIYDGPNPFCKQHATAFFCRDFDNNSVTDPWSDWSLSTADADISYGVGSQGRGATFTGTAKTYLTEQIQSSTNALAQLQFDVMIPQNLIDVKIADLVAGSTTLTLSEANGKITASSSAGGNSPSPFGFSLGVWHTILLALNAANTCEVILDGTSQGSLTFPQAPMNFTFDVGLLTGSLASVTLNIDNVEMQ